MGLGNIERSVSMTKLDKFAINMLIRHTAHELNKEEFNELTARFSAELDTMYAHYNTVLFDVKHIHNDASDTHMYIAVVYDLYDYMQDR
jgi:ribonuclease HIII